MKEDLTRSSSVGVRWQAQMEEHLKLVRNHCNAEMKAQTGYNAAIAQAHATAAVALAIAVTVGDLELPLSKLVDAVEEVAGA